MGQIPALVAKRLRQLAAEIRAGLTAEDALGRFKGVYEAMNRFALDYNTGANPGGVAWMPPVASPPGMADALAEVVEVLRTMNQREVIHDIDPKRQHTARKKWESLLDDVEERWVLRPDPAEEDWRFYDSTARARASVVIFPTVCNLGTTEEGGFGYLMATPLSHPPVWEFSGFSRDARVYQTLDNLARLAIATVTGVTSGGQVPPVELNRLRSHYEYQLLYGPPIGEGRSHSAAAFVLFAIAYLHARLGAEASRLMDYKRNLCFSADLDERGCLRPVEGIREKLLGVVTQWGNNLEVVLCRESQSGVEALVSQEPRLRTLRLHYPETAEELLSLAIGPVDPCRQAWLAHLRPIEFSTYWEPRLPRNEVERWRSFNSGDLQSDGQILSLDENGLLGALCSKGSHASVSVGFSESAFDHSATRNIRRGIVLVLSACPGYPSRNGKISDDAILWLTPENPLAVDVIYRLLQAIFNGREAGEIEVFVHFLSVSQPVLQTETPLNGKSIGNALARAQQEYKPEERGRFLRPVLDHWSERGRIGRFDSLEMYVISNAEVPDIADEVVDKRLPGFHIFQRIFVGHHDSVTTWVDHREADTLLRLPVANNGGFSPTIDDAIAEKLGGVPYDLLSARVILGSHCPREWEPSNLWTLVRNDDCFALSSVGHNPPTVVFRNPSEQPVVGLRVEYAVRGQQDQVHCVAVDRLGFYPVPDLGISPVSATQEVLSPEEQARARSDNWCQECHAAGLPARHMICRANRHRIGNRLVFPTLQSHWDSVPEREGLFAICPDTGEWRFHGAYLHFGDETVVLCSGEPLRIDATGQVAEARTCGDAMEIKTSRHHWFVVRMER